MTILLSSYCGTDKTVRPDSGIGLQKQKPQDLSSCFRCARKWVRNEALFAKLLRMRHRLFDNSPPANRMWQTQENLPFFPCMWLRDEALFVEALGVPHRLFRGHAQLSVGFLFMG